MNSCPSPTRAAPCPTLSRTDPARTCPSQGSSCSPARCQPCRPAPHRAPQALKHKRCWFEKERQQAAKLRKRRCLTVAQAVKAGSLRHDQLEKVAECVRRRGELEDRQHNLPEECQDVQPKLGSECPQECGNCSKRDNLTCFSLSLVSGPSSIVNAKRSDP